MKIAFKTSNYEKIDAVLATTNGKAKRHTIAYAGQIERAIVHAEQRLQDIPKNRRKGVVVSYTPAGPGKAYARKGRQVITTRVSLVCSSHGWNVTGIEREEIWADQPDRVGIEITKEQCRILLDKAVTGLIIAD